MNGQYHYNSLSSVNDPDLVKIINCPKVKLGSWPTALIEYDQLDNFVVKRDDLSGYGRGGIKVRKLEAILAYVRDNNYAGILTLVPNISNLRADLEFYKKNFESDFSLNLLISNVPELKKEAREKIAEDPKGNYTLVGKSNLLIPVTMLAKWFALRRTTMMILPSLMHPASVMGAAGGLFELYEQCKLLGRQMPKHIFISACTGSSAAGLVLGSEILRGLHLADIQIHTVKVFPANLKLWMWFVLRWTKIRYRLNVKIPYSNIHIHSKHEEVPYGASSPALISICKNVKENFDLNIDPIYGARAWSVMTDFLNGKYKGEDIVYWHCGYTPDWEISLQK